MGGRGSREVHHYHEDKESKEMARKANEEMAAIRSQMAEQERRNQENLERHQEALRRAEQLRAEERDAYVQRLQAEQEERRRESERAREQLEQHEREAEQRLVRANEEMAAIRSQMAEQERRNQENLERHQEALRRAEQLHAEEKDAFMKRLQAEQEERTRESERAREQLEQQEREAEQRLVEELQRERYNVQKAKVEKWQRLKRDYPIPSFLQKYVNEVSEDAEADAARDRFVNVAMLGDSGTGKSSLIKVILKHFGVDLPPDQMPKVSMEGDGTLLPTRFPLEKLGQVSLWDLPGQGTSKIPSMTYLCNMGLKYFDAVCIVTDGRWSEGDDNLLAAIHYAGIRCFVVRSKVDLAVDAGVEDKGWSLAETLSHVHQQLQRQTRLKPHRIHLLTSRDRFWKDFGSVDNFCKHLQEEVEASLKEEVAEQMFEEAPQEDVNMDAMDAMDAMDDCIMTCDDKVDKVECLRLDIDNQCFKSVGFVKRAGA